MKYLILLAAFLPVSVMAQKVLKSNQYYGPVEYNLPFGSDEKSPEKKSFEFSDFLNDLALNPESNDFNSFAPLNIPKKNLTMEDNMFRFQVKDTSVYSLFILRAWLKAEKYQKTVLKASADAAFSIISTGQSLLSSTKIPDSLTLKEEKIEFIKGFHPLQIHILVKPGMTEANFKLEVGADSTADLFSFLPENTKPSIDLYTLANLPSVGSAKISGDGQIAILSISQKSTPKGKSDKWLEFWDIKNKKMIRSLKGISDENNVKWVPGKRAISYTEVSDKKTSLWLHPLEGKPELLLMDIDNMGSYNWSDDGSFIIYSITGKPDKKDKKTNLLEGMASRLPGYYNYSYLYRLNVNDRKIQQLTFGKYGTDLLDISPDGKKILFTTGDYDYEQLPYSYNTFWNMDLNTFKADSLFTLYWGSSAEFIPGSNKITLNGGPSAFGTLGENVESGQVPNNYDGQTYIVDLGTMEKEAITKNFDPAISSSTVSPDGKFIYFICTDKDYNRLYKYSIEGKEFKKLENTPDLVRSLDISEDGRTALITGSNQQGDGSAYVFDTRKMECSLLHDPSYAELSKKKFGEINDWTFENEEGDIIDGRFYLPPDFDSEKKYPLIVYYYGGTTPVSRSFGGRYPYNWYAAQGYVVYVLQPRGTFGYGQIFSADHVNNWGKTTAGDIIMGTEKFLEAHSFIDKEAVGCIGASYGGFMTMYLITQTNIFSAAVSHAGISTLSSYWGEGYWGYAYSAVATQGAFPWNRKDIYVDQSPLFQADKVNTPILLTHGTSDTNVPPGESYQFYTALKILGKEVEMLEVPGQDHWVLDYEKYIDWKYSIIAWFDKHLKKEELWWNELYNK